MSSRTLHSMHSTALYEKKNGWMTSFAIKGTNPTAIPVYFVLDQGKLKATLFCPEPLRTQ